MSKHELNCQYKEPGIQCQETALASGFCYWHDSSIVKNKEDDVKNLERYARQGGLLRGISLKHAVLPGLNLVNHNSEKGYDLTNADFYRADLSNAHLFNTCFKNASLMKANLENANLHCANLENCNLLGVRLHGARIENIKFGDELIQEKEANLAEKAGDMPMALDLYEQAEEIYRDLRKHAEREGVFTMSGAFIQKELTMRRYQYPKFSRKRFMSKITDLFCGYGESPLRVVGISMLLILICAVFYFFTGIKSQDTILAFNPDNSLTTQVELFFNCLYYSIVTFTTLGYGDITPVGFSRAIAAIEAFTGSFTIALFVVVFVKKMTR